MNKDLKLILVIIVTLLLMFTTSLLLDLKIFQARLIRELIVYVAIVIEFVLGVLIFKLILIEK